MDVLAAFGNSSPDSGTTFASPWPGLFADVESRFGHVALTDEFLHVPPQGRIEILQQWIAGLTTQRDRALVEMFRDLASTLPDATIVDQIDLFRQECVERGFACPSSFAVLLQRY